MRIESASIALSSVNAASVQRKHTESLKAWIGPVRPDFEGRAAGQSGPTTGAAAQVSAWASQSTRAIAVAIAAAARKSAALAPPAPDTTAASDLPLDKTDTVRVAVVELLLKQVTGRDVRIRLSQVPTDAPASAAVTAPAAAAASPADSAPPAPAGWGLEFDAHDEVHDTEQTTFGAAGTVHTADGSRFDISLEATLSRAFHSQSDMSVRAGDGVRKDPLVIHFDGPASELGAGRFAFDIDGDGTKEQLPTLAGGSGFLVLDKNDDGKVNDGSELFGPATGQGFAELAKYDEDGNGWIDDGDSVFRRLRIWRPDGVSVNDDLKQLDRFKIGAIGIGNVATPFQFRDGANQTTGYAVSSGIYVNEKGRAGVVQQIDFSV